MITRASVTDAMIIAQLAAQMWDSHSSQELAANFATIIENGESAIYICMVDESIIGFAQCQLRHDYVEGTESSPVAYLEGVFIKEEYRKLGYGKALVDCCIQWAKEKGCTEFASDCELDNCQSIAFHLSAGFQEANRIVCFTRKI